MQEPRRIAAVTANRHRIGGSHPTLQARTAGLSIIAEPTRAGTATLLRKSRGGSRPLPRIGVGSGAATQLRKPGSQVWPSSRLNRAETATLTMQEPRRIAAATAHRRRIGPATPLCKPGSQVCLSSLSSSGRGRPPCCASVNAPPLDRGTATLSAANLQLSARQQTLPNSRSKANGKCNCYIGLPRIAGLTYKYALHVRELGSRPPESAHSFPGRQLTCLFDSADHGGFPCACLKPRNPTSPIAIQGHHRLGSSYAA